jgi:hypothetical protein
MMFNVGDLVVFKSTGIVKSRYDPLKKLGIILTIERNVYQSYDGTKEDAIGVFWIPLQQEERLMEFYLEHLEEK